jgi:hypothetical protein
MKIKGWDKLRYKFFHCLGASLTIDATWSEDSEYDGTTSYFLTICDADDVGETLISVKLKEGVMGEFYMSVDLPQQQITPNIKRIFRQKDLLSMDGFIIAMLNELSKNGMVHSYITLISEMQDKRRKNTFGSSSISLPF